MAKTLDRPTVHPEVHPDIHPDVHPGVDEFIKKTLDEHESTGRRPIRWMRWLAAALIAVVAAGVAIWALPGDETEYAVPRTADGTERWLTYSQPAPQRTPTGTELWVIEGTPPATPQRTPTGTELWVIDAVAPTDYAVPRTADGTDRWDLYTTEFAVPRSADGTSMWFEYLTPQVPRTADGAEGWIASLQPAPEYAVPTSADGRVGWFEYLTPRVPRTADGAEGWILGPGASETRVMTELRPLSQVPEGAIGEVTYLPVTPSRTVVPGGLIELSVQPVFRPAA